MKNQIGFVTCQDLSPYFPSKKNPLFTHDDQVAVDFLQDKGFSINPVVWGTPPSELKEKNYSMLIIRSTWDYMDSEKKRTQFLTWLRECHQNALNVFNPIPLMLWNMDKRYLLDLQTQNVSIVDSTLIPQNESIDLVSIFKERGPFVIKPTISAAAKDTFRILSEEDAQNLAVGKHPDCPLPFSQIRKRRDMLIQPYHKEIETETRIKIGIKPELKYRERVLTLTNPKSILVASFLPFFERKR